jgi:hypothetical protein
VAKAKPKTEEEAPAEVIPTAPADVAAPVDDNGFVGFDQEDLVIPRLRIAQPTNRQDWTPGKFYESLSDESFDKLEGVVALRLNKSRVWFEDTGDGQPSCASDDFVRPSDRIENPVSPFCGDCPNAQWGADRTPPICNETWNFLLVHQGMPYYIAFSSSALANTRKLVTALFLRAKQLKKPLWGFQFDIGLKKTEFAKGVAYMPTFSNVKAVPKDEIEIMGEMQETFTSKDNVKVDGADGEFPFGENE